MEKIKGITLISLVITIIIILILVGVSLNLFVGEHGIIKQAIDAKDLTDKSQIIELIKMDIFDKEILNYGTLYTDELTEILEKYGNLSEENYLMEKTLNTKNNINIAVSEIYDGKPTFRMIWDVSAKQNGSIRAYAYDNDNDGYYDIEVKTEDNAKSNDCLMTIEQSSENFWGNSDITRDKVKSIRFLNEVLANENSRNLFSKCSSLENLDLKNLNTENVKHMSSFFSSCENIQDLDVSSLKTKNVINMSWMFNGCFNLKNIDLSNFNFNNVTSIEGIFYDCKNLQLINLGNFNIEKVTNLRLLFVECNSLKNLSFTNFNTKNVTTMQQTFEGCSSLENIDLSSLDTSSLKSLFGTFHGCKALKNLNVSNWNTTNLTSLNQTFRSCESLNEVDLSDWNTTNVTDMSLMFWNTATNKVYVGENWTTENANTTNMFMKNYQKIYYYSEIQPAETGYFWHYVNGKITAW